MPQICRRPRPVWSIINGPRSDPLRPSVTVCYREIHVQSNGRRRESSRAALAQFAMAILTSLINFLLGKRRAVSVQAAFRRSKDSYLEFLGIAERRATVVSPDHRLVWQNAFRLQHLLIRQQYLRFEHLVANHQLGDASRSIASIEERLSKGWAVTEEAALEENLPSYKEISSEIEDIKSKWRPLGKELIAALEGDSEYREARITLSERAQKRLAKLGG